MRLVPLMLLLLATNSAAAGIGVTPAEIRFEMEEGRVQTREITVYNLQDEDATIEVSGNGNHRFSYNETLKANSESKLFVEAIGNEIGNHSSYAYITTTGKSNGVNVKLGAAVKITSIVHEAEKQRIALGIAITIATALAGLAAYIALAKAARIVAAEMKG